MPQFLVISTSHNDSSKSRILAERAVSSLLQKKVDAEMMDCAAIELPMCDGDRCYEHPNVKAASKKIESANGLLVASPIYNYDVNAVAKNLVELTGDAWNEKVVGFLCSAGGGASYMSVMSFANSLMLDFRCVILPRFVYAVDRAFDEKSVPEKKVLDRIDDLADDLIRFSRVT